MMKSLLNRFSLTLVALGAASTALADGFRGDWYYDYRSRDGEVRVMLSLPRSGIASILVTRPGGRVTATGKWYDRGNYADVDFPQGSSNNGRAESMRLRFIGRELVPDRWNRDVFGSSRPRFTTKNGGFGGSGGSNGGGWGGSGGSNNNNDWGGSGGSSQEDGFPNFREGRWKASSGRGDFGRVEMELIADRNGDARLRNRFDRRDDEELTGTWRLRRGLLEFTFTRSNQRNFRRESMTIRDTGNWTATTTNWDRRKYGSAPLRFRR